MDELHVVFGFSVSHESHVRDLALLFARGEEYQIAGLQIFWFDFLAHRRLVARLPGKLDIDGTVGGGCERTAVHAGTGGAAPFVGCAVIGSGRFNHGADFLFVRTRFLRTAAGSGNNRQKKEENGGLKKSVLRTFARQPHRPEV